MRMPDKIGEHSARTGPRDGAKPYVAPSVQDESKEGRGAARMLSQPTNVASNPTLVEESANITNISPELLAHITETVTKEVVEKLRHVSILETTKSEPPKVEPHQEIYEKAPEPPQATPIGRPTSPDKSSSTASPPLSAQRVYTPPSPNWASKSGTNNNDSPPLSPIRSPPGSPTKEKSGVRFTTPKGSVDKEGARNVRPQGYRSFSNAELSTVDQKWGRLFDSDRKPTARLGQFLRGLANHIIAEFEPKNSLVISPLKMATFYADNSLAEEAFPFVSIFKSQSNELLSELYQDLACQHHLIQEENYKDPFIPALTPIGFAHWMTKWIIAYPEQEAARLEKVVCSLPIDADGLTIDGKPERLPKQISRYLLPNKEDPDVKKELKEAMLDFLYDLGMSTRRQGSITSPPLSRRTSSTLPPSKARPIDIPQAKTSSRPADRDRPLYCSTSSDASAIDDALPIERDRQPYSAQPGNGRVFTESFGTHHADEKERANSMSRVARGPDLERQRHIRTQSSTNSNPYVPNTRPGGSRRQQSPPIQKFSQSNPLSLDTGGVHASDTFSSPPKNGPSADTTSLPKGLVLPQSDPHDRDRAHEYDHDSKERYTDARYYDRDSRRSTFDGPRSRRSTVGETTRIVPDSGILREPDRRDKIHENRDRERDKTYEPKSAEPRQDRGPILHQEFRPDAKSALPDEEYYRSGPPRGEYDSSQSKYIPRY